MQQQPAKPNYIAAGAGDVYAVQYDCALKGWSIAESTGAAGASFYLRDGIDATGPIVAIVKLAANESSREWFGLQGIQFKTGIFVDRLTGSSELVLFTDR